jgi:hypothetical protein
LKVVNTEGETTVGVCWYKNFMARNREALKRGRCKVKDQKRCTWCTYEHFSNMYDGVYEAMVEAGVAVEHNEEKMFDVSGNIVTDVNQMDGRPSKYELKHPERVIFVDETGCNTNQKDDGYAGGQLFVLPCEKCEFGIVGSVTDIHFSVLCFNNALGTPLMCAVILKSDRNICDLPISWKLGIDVRRDI